MIVILMLVAVFLDQISKYLVVIYMELEESVDIIPGIFRFTYIQNTGAAFGSFSDSRWVFMILSSVAIIAILVYIFWKKPQSKLLLSSLILIVGGGVGNMIDRVRLGYVIDFLDFCALPDLWMWVFNIADSFVVVGAGLMILWLILDMIKETKAEKAKKLAGANENNADEQGANTTLDDWSTDAKVSGEDACAQQSDTDTNGESNE
ncbi:MAG: signal peptidase II [Ruminococcaceae bacterium]|nr:signal peptidase II [Oscillospiraceae bacterium]